MAEPKQKQASSLRTPKAKKLGLSVPQALRLPHDDLIKPLQRTATSEESGRPHLDSVDGRARGVDGRPSTLYGDVDGLPSTSENVDGHIEIISAVHKKDRHSKAKARYDSRIDADLFKRIKKFCIAHDMEQQTFAELSAVHYMDYVAGHKQQGVDGLPSHDDLMMLFKTDEDIISLYRTYLPLNKWRAGDDREGRQFNDTDRRIIEYGILQSLLRVGKKRIHSFKYFVPEIKTIIDLHPGHEHLEMALHSLRRHWAQLQEQKPS